MTGSFAAARNDDDEVAAEMRRVYEATGLIDRPAHGDGNGRRSPLAGDHPVVTMATAHPAKFPDAVEHAIGVRPALPEHLADLFEREERTETLPNDLAAVEDYVTVAVAQITGM